MNIGIDIDDTISLTFEETYPKAKEYVKNDLGRKVIEEECENIVDYYIEQRLKITEEEMRIFWRKNLVQLLKSVKPKENSIEVINKLKTEGHNIIIITARWNEDYCNSEKLSKEWLDKYKIPYDKIYTGMDSKKEIAIEEKLDLFIDDSIRNCREVSSAGIKCLLFLSKVNCKNEEIKKFNTVSSWNEVYEKIYKEEI